MSFVFKSGKAVAEKFFWIALNWHWINSQAKNAQKASHSFNPRTPFPTCHPFIKRPEQSSCGFN